MIVSVESLRFYKTERIFLMSLWLVAPMCRWFITAIVLMPLWLIAVVPFLLPLLLVARRLRGFSMAIFGENRKVQVMCLFFAAADRAAVS